MDDSDVIFPDIKYGIHNRLAAVLEHVCRCIKKTFELDENCSIAAFGRNKFFRIKCDHEITLSEAVVKMNLNMMDVTQSMVIIYLILREAADFRCADDLKKLLEFKTSEDEVIEAFSYDVFAAFAEAVAISSEMRKRKIILKFMAASVSKRPLILLKLFANDPVLFMKICRHAVDPLFISTVRALLSCKQVVESIGEKRLARVLLVLDRCIARSTEKMKFLN